MWSECIKRYISADISFNAFKAGEMVQGEVLKVAEETLRRKDSIQYVVTEELVEAISSDIISEVDMDRDMRLSQRIVELLSIYM